MKRRLLPSGFFIFIIGLAFLSVSSIFYDGEKRTDNPETSAEYLAKIRNNQVTGQLAPKDVLLARESVLKNEQFKSGRSFDLNWNLAGPNNMGGRTRAIMFDNQDASGQTIYAGSVMGGMFKTENGGSKWFKINLANGNLNVTCLTQAPGGEIYAGTGEGFTVEGYTVLSEWGYSSGLVGQGIFKSTDGENFTLLTATKPALNGNDELEWGYINEIAADPTSSKIYASTNTGLMYSEDGGNTWGFARTADTADLNMVSQDVKVGSNGIVIAEVGNACYVTENGDPSNFMQVTVDTLWNDPQDLQSFVGRIEFSIPATNPDIIYALVVNTYGALINVYRSDDKGMNWRIIGPGHSGNFNLFNTGTTVSSVSVGIGLYSCAIETFPTDPDRIIVGGVNMWEGIKVTEVGLFDWQERSDGTTALLDETYVPANHHTYKFVPGTANECLVGSNGGINKGKLDPALFIFQSLNKDYTGSQFYAVSYTRDKINVLGGAQDLGSVYIDGVLNAFDPKRGEDIWTTDAGLPDGKTGTYCAKSLIFPEMAIYSRNPQPEPVSGYEIFVRRNEYGGGTDWAAPTRMFDNTYISQSFMSPFVLWESFEDYNSRDSVPFKAINDVPAGTTLPIESDNANRLFFHTFTESLTKGDSIQIQDIIASKFFIGGSNRVLMTKDILKFDRDPEWYTIANNTTGFQGTPQCLAYSADGNHLFVGTLEGKLYRLSNITYAWNFERADVSSPYCVVALTKIPVYLPGTTTEISQVITSVAVNPYNAEQVMITLGNYGNEHYVYMSDNALDEFPVLRPVGGDTGNGGLPAVPVYSCLFEMDPDNHMVLVGTEYGIYASDNINATNPTWVPENNNVGRVPVFMLKQQTIRKQDDKITLINVDTTEIIVKGVDNYGVIYGATFGRGLIRLDEFQKPVGIFNPGPASGTGPEFKVYPNPATDMARIEFTLNTSNKVSIQMFDLTGKLVRTMDMGHLPTGNHEVNLSVSSMPSGTYILKVMNGSQGSSGKIVIY